MKISFTVLKLQSGYDFSNCELQRNIILYKNIVEVMVLNLCISSVHVLYLYKFSRKYFKG